jgi:hypothetical protein
MDGQTERQIGRKADRQMDGWTDIHTCRLTNKHTARKKQTYRQVERQTDGWMDIQKLRQADRQIDR